MEWLNDLRGGIVAVDTAPFIYFVERHPTHSTALLPFFQALDAGEIFGVTSILTVVEVLVQPLRRGDIELANKYRDILLGARHLKTLELSRDIAEEAARLRAVHNFQTPDAMQLATAVCAGAIAFVTNDAALKSISTVRVIHLDDLMKAL